MPLGEFCSASRSALTLRTLMQYSASIEASIVLSQVIWLFRTRRIRRRAKEAGLNWDEFPEAQAWQEDRLRIPWHRKEPIISVVDGTTGGDAAGDQRVPIESTETKRDRSGDIERCKGI